MVSEKHNFRILMNKNTSCKLGAGKDEIENGTR